MKYKISRSSDCMEYMQPCEEAYQEMLPSYDCRTYKTFEEYDEEQAKFNGTWLSKGSEHVETPDGISRRVGDTLEWVVNIDSLEQLNEFVKKYGDCIISKDEIEIYDDYRE